MHRRIFLTAMAPLAWGPSAYGEPATDAEVEAEAGAQPQPHYTVSADTLQRSVAQRFPLRYPVPGVLNLDVQAPHLRLLPASNRLSAEMAVDAAGQALARRHRGSLEVDFALRYEASDRTIRAHQLRIQRLQFPTLQPGVVAMLNSYAPALAEQSLLEVVLHTLRPQDLALADVMGMRPDRITVTEEGLVIGLVVKPL